MAGGYVYRPPLGPEAVAARVRAIETAATRARQAAGNATAHAPFLPWADNVSHSNLTLAGQLEAAVSENVPVPAGFTGAVVMMTVSLDGTRDASTGGVNQLSIEAYADNQVASPPIKTRTFASANSQGSITQSFGAIIVGLGDELVIGANGWGSTGWVAGSGVGTLSFIAMFTR